jgi:hypothetical protein
MIEVKTWKAGVANEDWKVDICRRDEAEAKKMLSLLHYILVGGNKTETEMLLDISQLTGIQIADGIRNYIVSRQKAMRNAA